MIKLSEQSGGYFEARPCPRNSLRLRSSTRLITQRSEVLNVSPSEQLAESGGLCSR